MINSPTRRSRPRRALIAIHPQLKATHRGRLARREHRTRAVEVRNLYITLDDAGHPNNQRTENE